MLTKKIDEKLTLEKDLTLIQLIDYFKEIYGEDFKDLIFDKKKNGKVSSFLSIILNGKSYRDEKFFETPLKDGDDLSFLYEFFGG